jgi:poly-gamma-glutamate synthesis protein (capsule biosynthesis protein)
MPKPTLQTLDRRAVRAYRQKKRDRARVVVAVVALVLIGGGVAWAVTDGLLGGGKTNRTAETPAASAEATASKPATSSAVATAAPDPADAATETTDASRPATLTVAGAGDMIFDRQVKALVKASGGAAPLARVASLLKSADIAIANLESTLASSGTKNASKDVTFRGDPRGIESLKVAGLDAVSLANNHVLDYGPQPLLDTIKALYSAGIGHAGAGANKAAAWKPATIERNGATTAYLAYSHIVPPGFIAQDDRAGLASGRQDMALVEEAIREAKKTHDYVIVSFHWGVEYTDNPTAEQKQNAHRAIDAGADMVLAHHPHVIQGVEFYKDGLIAYSLGDFVFDHYSRKTGEAFILNAEMGPDGISDVNVVPVYLDKYGRPEVVTGSAASSILKRLKTISAPLGSTVTITGDTASITP